MVTRYDLAFYDEPIGPQLEPADNGDWVGFDEYEALAARLAEVEANMANGSFYKETDIDALQARAEAAETALARLRAEQDALVGAVIEEAVKEAAKWVAPLTAHRMRKAIRALRPDATAALAKMLEEAEHRGGQKALQGFDDAMKMRAKVATACLPKEGT